MEPIIINLNDTQKKIFEELQRDKNALQQQLNALNKRESDIVTIALGFNSIDPNEVESVELIDIGLIVRKKIKVELAHGG